MLHTLTKVREINPKSKGVKLGDSFTGTVTRNSLVVGNSLVLENDTEYMITDPMKEIILNEPIKGTITIKTANSIYELKPV